MRKRQGCLFVSMMLFRDACKLFIEDRIGKRKRLGHLPKRCFPLSVCDGDRFHLLVECIWVGGYGLFAKGYC